MAIVPEEALIGRMERRWICHDQNAYQVNNGVVSADYQAPSEHHGLPIDYHGP
jgi:hypothetical protein